MSAKPPVTGPASYVGFPPKAVSRSADFSSVQYRATAIRAAKKSDPAFIRPVRADALTQRPYRPHRHAQPGRQPAYRSAINSTQSRDPHPPSPSDPRPPNGTEGPRTRVARGSERRRQKHQLRPRPRRAPNIRPAMRGTRHEPRPPDHPRPASAPQVNPGPQSGGQANVARHHQHQPPHPADPRQIPAQPGAIPAATVVGTPRRPGPSASAPPPPADPAAAARP